MSVLDIIMTGILCIGLFSLLVIGIVISLDDYFDVRKK